MYALKLNFSQRINASDAELSRIYRSTQYNVLVAAFAFFSYPAQYFFAERGLSNSLGNFIGSILNMHHQGKDLYTIYTKGCLRHVPILEKNQLSDTEKAFYGIILNNILLDKLFRCLHKKNRLTKKIFDELMDSLGIEYLADSEFGIYHTPTRIDPNLFYINMLHYDGENPLRGGQINSFHTLDHIPDEALVYFFDKGLMTRDKIYAFFNSIDTFYKQMCGEQVSEINKEQAKQAFEKARVTPPFVFSKNKLTKLSEERFNQLMGMLQFYEVTVAFQTDEIDPKEADSSRLGERTGKIKERLKANFMSKALRFKPKNSIYGGLFLIASQSFWESHSGSKPPELNEFMNAELMENQYEGRIQKI